MPPAKAFANKPELQVSTIILARAASEREPPVSLVQWHDFIARYFALGAALKQAVSIFDSDQDTCAHSKDIRSFMLEVASSPLPEHAKEHSSLLASHVTPRAGIEHFCRAFSSDIELRVSSARRLAGMKDTPPEPKVPGTSSGILRYYDEVNGGAYFESQLAGLSPTPARWARS